jgi:pimeloyl-ACP methyl ester carboxylesterase
LAEDVVQVLDALNIPTPVLAGHSAGGEELTRLGDKHSKRLAGLVYLDAAFDPDDLPASSPEYMALFYKLPAAMRTHAGPAATDLKTFSAYREWQMRNRDVAFPESELHNQFETNPDGSVQSAKAIAGETIRRLACRCWHFFQLPVANANTNRRMRKSALQWMRSMRQLPLTPADGEKTSSRLPVECESLT